MKMENDLIPYKPSQIPEGPYLIFAPHPDDEVLGMGGTIALARDRNIEVHVAYVTDGEKGGDPEVRRKELFKAMELLDVKRLHFLNIEDRSVHSSLSFEKKVKKLVQDIQPIVVFLPSIQEFHPDHRATTFRVWQLLKNYNQFDGKIWLYEISRQSEINKLIDITSVIERKKQAIIAHKSQINQRALLDIAIAINKARSYTLDQRVEFAEGFYELGNHESLFYPRLLPYLGDLALIPQYPLVSVIVRTKDRCFLLKEAIESIISQSYPNIEIIVVNDGGQDVSNIIELFRASPRIIKYINLAENVGRSRAGNIGLNEASGEYVCFLDDDDLFYPTHIETLVESIKNTGFDVVYSDSYTAQYIFDERQKRKLVKKQLYFSQDFSFNQLLLENFIPLICLIFKKSLIERTGGFDESFDLYEDWELLIRCATLCQGFHHIEKVTAEYRIWHNSQITQAQRASFAELQAYSKILDKHRELITHEVIFSYFQLGGHRKGEILRLQQDKEELSRTLEVFKQEKKTKDEIIAILESDNVQLKNNLTEFQEVIKQKDDAINHLINDNEQLLSQLNEIKRSLGWHYLQMARKVLGYIAPVNSRRGHMFFLTKRAISIYKHEGLPGIRSRIRYRLKNWRKPKVKSPEIYLQVREMQGFKVKKPVDIIIPVYNALNELKECLERVLVFTNLSYHKIVIIDDKSPDTNVKSFLKEFKQETNDKKISILYNKTNLGFSATINRALSCSRNDCIILNSDTLVTPLWVEKLQRSAYSKPLIATVTPFSNHAFICSFPKPLQYNFLPPNFTLDDFSQTLEKASLFYYPEIPFGSGFCMYIRRKAIEEIGFFDQKLFGKGYGEDADFCLRAANAGYKNILDDATYIYHKGGASFESTKDSKKLKEKNDMIKKNLKKLKLKYPDYHDLIQQSVKDLNFIRNYLLSRLKIQDLNNKI